jgi:NTP pyrophosphatase (non-canonical NTP hydrolase)
MKTYHKMFYRKNAPFFKNGPKMEGVMKCISALLLLLLPNFSHAAFNTHEMQQFQRAFDEENFQINDGFEKTRHILLHLMKSTGKMASYCEVKEHGKTEPDPSQLINEVLPDLLMHALQIANQYDIDLGAKYMERIEFITNRSKARTPVTE